MKQEMEINGQGLPRAVRAITKKSVRKAGKPTGPFFLPVSSTGKK